MSKEEKEKGNREFQIALLEYQLRYESEISYLTAVMAVAFSFLVTILALSISIINIGIPEKALVKQQRTN